MSGAQRAEVKVEVLKLNSAAVQVLNLRPEDFLVVQYDRCQLTYDEAQMIAGQLGAAAGVPAAALPGDLKLAIVRKEAVEAAQAQLEREAKS